MVVAQLRLVLQVHEARSLKDKRRVLASVRDRLKSRFNVSVAEVESQDDIGVIVLGIAMVANDRRFLQSSMDRLVLFVEELYLAPVIGRELELVSFRAPGS